MGLLSEVEAYAFLLVVTFLVDHKRYEEVCALAVVLEVVSCFRQQLLPNLSGLVSFVKHVAMCTCCIPAVIGHLWSC